MSELSRFFLPLDTLVGWPLVLGANNLNALLLFFGIPGVVAAIIISAVRITSGRGRQQPSDSDYVDPVWYGPEPTGQTPGHEQQRRGAEKGTSTAGGGRKGRGGASARW